MWITHTVSELIFAYKLKAKKNSNSNEFDLKRADNIIQYLAKLHRTNDISIVLGGDQGIHTVGTVYTSHAPDGED